MLSKTFTLLVLTFLSINIYNFTSILNLCLPRFISLFITLPAVLFIIFIVLLIVNKMTVLKNIRLGNQKK